MRRQDGEVGSRQQVGNVGSRAEQAHGGGAVRDPGRQPRLQWPLPGDDDKGTSGMPRKQRRGLDENVEPLLRGEPRDADQQCPVADTEVRTHLPAGPPGGGQAGGADGNEPWAPAAGGGTPHAIG